MNPYLKRTLQLALGIASVVVIVSVAFIVDGWNSPVNRLRRALAEPVEFVSERDFMGDYTRQLTGRLSPDEFTSFARDFQFSSEPRRNVSPARLFIAGSPDGWNLPAVLDEAYHESSSGGYQVTFARAGDRVFFEYSSW